MIKSGVAMTTHRTPSKLGRYDVTVVDAQGSRYTASLDAMNAWHAMNRMTKYVGVGVRVVATKSRRAS